MLTKAVFLLFAALANAVPTNLAARQEAGYHWVDTWTSMPQLVEQSNLPPAPYASGSCFKDATLRQTLHMSIGGSRLRIQISNTFGGSDLPITAAAIANPTGGKAGAAGIDTSSIKALTFNNGSASITIKKGDVAYTDPIDFDFAPQSEVTVTLYSQAGQSGTSITGHPGSRVTSYMQQGNHVNASSVQGANTEHWYWVVGAEAWAPANTSALIILGDSITDGRGSTDNANNRWPDLLLARMQKSGIMNVAVDNQAAGGNAVLNGGLGPYLLSRYQRDAINQQGVKWVMIFEGVNDIGSAAASSGTQTQIANQLIAAFTKIVGDCKKAGLLTIGATITPFGGSGQSYSSPVREQARQTVNKWIMTSGTFDYSVDFSSFVGQGDHIISSYDSGDHLHMNPAGYQQIADKFPLDIFSNATTSS